MKAISPFTVDSFEARTWDEGAGVPLGQARLTKTFTGALAGKGLVEMLSVANAEGPRSYVALERVTGTLDGREGSFVFKHVGDVTGAGPTLELTVVPGTGTGALAGLTGRGRIDIDAAGKHTLIFEYQI
jgi:hypothetical protein